ncbi:hypothetical protein DOK_07224 [gamma proteobacterium BDW918]|uniref:DUF4345 domain-containing protein n=1 Tax=Zhongshania aliphaticivorans TaxID=1470434 RepID=A0A127M797_9GAMM|nr:hypothetical protein [Zhongshania aliphaticivorans]AMO69085.1 hypothetical protein AZF00_12570 [Zhongshania aliphaticivorans]EIF43649.1 hypothetical protein DOK_07224 [gamma proteobacterium BDW918]
MKNTLGSKILRAIVCIPAIIFIVTGLQFLLDPAAAVKQFGMPLLDGVGRSSQIGDMAGFFLTCGLCVLIAVSTGKRVWFHPAAMLTSITAMGRILAWLLHDAALAINLIAPEIIFTALFLFAASRLPAPAAPSKAANQATSDAE